MLTPRTQVIEPNFIHEIEYDPDFDTYEDDYEDFDYTNYDIDDERDEEESGDVKW